jgi:mercuric reductase
MTSRHSNRKIEYDLIILGQGAAAFAAAIKSNELDVTAAMVGDSLTPGAVVGGTCINVGCVPSKRLITVGTLFHNAANNSFEGIRYGRGILNFRKVVQQKNRLVSRLRKDKYSEVLKNLEHVTYYHGKARFLSRNEISVNNETLRAEKFVIATGARASVLPVRGIDEIDYLTNEEALDLRTLPKSMCVIGGRVLGLEFAQMYAQFGTKVTVLQRSDRILPDDEPEISEALARSLSDMQIKIYTGSSIKSVSKKGKNKIIKFTANGKDRRVECEQLLFATGRKPNTDYLDLEKVGVKIDDRGFIIVNKEMHTSAPHIWAAGDVIGEPMLETIAAKEGSVAVQNAFTQEKKEINFNEVPSAVFTYPEVARVGLTEAEANHQGIKCACNTLPMDFVAKAHIIGDTRGLVKLVLNRDNNQIVGVHILAPHAADMIHEGVLAVKHKMTIDDIIDTVHVFPTLSEAIKLAAQSFYKDVGKLSCCTE